MTCTVKTGENVVAHISREDMNQIHLFFDGFMLQVWSFIQDMADQISMIRSELSRIFNLA